MPCVMPGVPHISPIGSCDTTIGPGDQRTRRKRFTDPNSNANAMVGATTACKLFLFSSQAQGH